MARRPIIQAGAFGENWQVPVPVPQFRYRYQQWLGDQGNRYSDGYDGKVDIVLAATRYDGNALVNWYEIELV